MAELTAVPIPPSVLKSSLSVDQVSYRSGLALFHYWAFPAAAAVFLLALLYFTSNRGGSSHTNCARLMQSSQGALCALTLVYMKPNNMLVSSLLLL